MDEIDQLIYAKWFGAITDSMIRLSHELPIEDLNTLKLIVERYEDRLEDLDQGTRELEKAFEDLASLLVVLQ